MTFTRAGALPANAPVASPAQFEALERHVRGMLAEMGRSLAQGENEADPIVPQSSGRLTCETCPYHAVCRFDTLLEPVRTADSLSRSDFFARLENADGSAERRDAE